MSINAPEITIEFALSGISKDFRKRIIGSYCNLKNAFIEGKYETCGLRGGKFCEVIIRYLQETLTGTYIPFGSKIKNFNDECFKLEQTPKSAGTESYRILIPRAINFIYTIRNKRSISHVGGDLDANEIDSVICMRVSDWCMCELLRVVHTLSLEDAQNLVNSIATRNVPILWEVLGKKRILNPNLDYRSQVLLFLYSQPTTGIPVEDLYEWSDHSHKYNFKNVVLKPLHKQRLIEYDLDTQFAFISPTGSKKVEDEILSKIIGSVS